MSLALAFPVARGRLCFALMKVPPPFFVPRVLHFLYHDFWRFGWFKLRSSGGTSFAETVVQMGATCFLIHIQMGALSVVQKCQTLWYKSVKTGGTKIEKNMVHVSSFVRSLARLMYHGFRQSCTTA